jgi:hypothetical protein
MARAQGARAQLALAFESVYGTAPASGYKLMPFAQFDLGASQPLIENELLGFGRDPLAPIKDAITADGSVTIPLDVENLGMWLKGAFGAPTTTGTTPKTHTFQSGGVSLPSMSIELGLPEVPHYAMSTGVMVDKLSWTMQRSGLLTGKVDLVAQGEAVAAVTGAGTPTSMTLQRFGHFNGSITRDGSALANIVSAEIAYANNLDRVETIRADGKIDGADPSIASLTGSFTARFADQTLLNQAIAGTPCELIFAHSLGANASFTFTAHAVYLPRPKIAVPGPGGIQATFDWQAAKATSPARMCTAVLVNTVAAY